MFEFLCALVFILGAFYRSKEEEEYQEDPEGPDFVEGQEEDFAEGKSYPLLGHFEPIIYKHILLEPVLNIYIACLFEMLSS